MVNDKKSKKDIEEQLLEKLESLNYMLNKNRVLDIIVRYSEFDRLR